ncbi:hypothetical protein C1H46_027757 [Malus baccata]|uniref:peptidyl-tRNA hydrolase n=1 Tax=Malus baccata TaxID=106549 RepID=A0A540LJV2_MALBA|nr:hypothetical protein C1H46_027757 [Malus baccata]
MSQPAAEATPNIPKSDTMDVLVQYVVLRRDLIDTWPTGSVVTQGCHASVSAIWSHKGDPITLQYCSPENIDSMHKLFQLVTVAGTVAAGFDIQGIGEELPWIRNRRCADGKKWRCSRDVVAGQKYCHSRAYPASPRVLTQLVPVVFQKAVNRVKVDPSAQTDYVEAGSKVELPLWLAYELHFKQVVKMKVPTCFNHRTKLELGADGAAVDLRSRCLYFYEFGCKIAPLGLRKWYMTRTPMDKLVFTVTCHDLVLRQFERENNAASNPVSAKLARTVPRKRG